MLTGHLPPKQLNLVELFTAQAKAMSLGHAGAKCMNPPPPALHTAAN